MLLEYESSLLDLTRFNCLPQRFSINRWDQNPGPLLQLDGLHWAACRADPAPNATVQIHLRYILIAQGQGLSGTSINAGLAASAKLLIPYGLKTGGKGQTGLWLGKGGLQDHTMTGAAVAHEVDLLSIDTGMDQPRVL